MNKKQAIQIGAGNIGRGLNGFILNKNNYKITFLDISDYLVNLLNKKDFYQVIEINKINVKKRVDNFDSINILDEKSILKNIENYSIFTISIGFNNLIKLKSLFQKIIKKLNKNKIKKYINIIAIENGINASTHLKKIIYSVLTKEEKKYANKYIGFVNCVVDRIVPNNQDKTLNIKVQKYYELILDENSWKGKKIQKNVIYSKNIIKFIERKLYMLNAIHCFIAWKGIKNNFKYIYEFKKNKKIKNEVNSLLNEFKKILINKHNFSEDELNNYSKKIIKRLSNKKIKDNVLRVGRDVKRKISENERFIKPLKYSIKKKIKNLNIIKAISLVFSNLNFEDKELREIKNSINNIGIEKTIKNYIKINDKKIIESIIKYAKNN